MYLSVYATLYKISQTDLRLWGGVLDVVTKYLMLTRIFTFTIPWTAVPFLDFFNLLPPSLPLPSLSLTYLSLTYFLPPSLPLFFCSVSFLFLEKFHSHSLHVSPCSWEPKKCCRTAEWSVRKTRPFCLGWDRVGLTCVRIKRSEESKIRIDEICLLEIHGMECKSFWVNWRLWVCVCECMCVFVCVKERYPVALALLHDSVAWRLWTLFFYFPSTLLTHFCSISTFLSFRLLFSLDSSRQYVPHITEHHTISFVTAS